MGLEILESRLWVGASRAREKAVSEDIVRRQLSPLELSIAIG